MTEFLRFTVGTGEQVHFCDPARGSRVHENTNVLLRQYLPKAQSYLFIPTRTSTRLLENSPSASMTLADISPFEAFAEAIALTR